MKKVIHTENAPKAIGPYSQGILANGFIFTSGQLPINPDTNELIADISQATAQCLNNIKAILEAGGSSLENIVKCNILLSDIADFAAMNKVYEGFFDDQPPARICYQAAKLPMNAIIEIEAVAIVGEVI